MQDKELHLCLQDVVVTKFECPLCHSNFIAHGDTSGIFTANCPTCGKLLLVNNLVVRDFHQAIHETNPSWPVDGQGTSYIEF